MINVLDRDLRYLVINNDNFYIFGIYQLKKIKNFNIDVINRIQINLNIKIEVSLFI